LCVTLTVDGIVRERGSVVISDVFQETRRRRKTDSVAYFHSVFVNIIHRGAAVLGRQPVTGCTFTEHFSSFL